MTTENNRPQSLLRRFDETRKGDDRKLLFRAVAERVKTGLLTHDEAELIAGWFERLADGEKPAKVLLGETRGRKAGSNGVKYLKGQDVSLPDHVDLCWSLRQWIDRTGDEDRIFREAAARFGCTKDHIERIYAEHLPTLGPDPSLEK
ncbi:hypothetical protein [Pseudoxanthomonas koreensis]|uniref:hypothetical protein n=1 Tax=Pseudoxanthomonas koreensis TaxID=266061 RepID=UPI0013920005|nr:hypothetical protein [Pseudoxanthomonas koreensis]